MNFLPVFLLSLAPRRLVIVKFHIDGSEMKPAGTFFKKNHYFPALKFFWGVLFASLFAVHIKRM